MLRGELSVELTRRLAGDCLDLAGEQGEQNAILVGRPGAAVEGQERCTGRFLATKADFTSTQTRHKPFESHGDLNQSPPEACRDSVDHGRGHQRLADPRVRAPARPVGVEVLDRNGEVGVGIHQAGVGGDDAVPVGICIVARGDVVLVLVADQACHRIWRGAIHPDLAVGIESHE